MAKPGISANTRERVIDACITCISAYGYNGATTQVIAKHSGITRGPQFYHFGDRASMMFEVFKHIVERQYEEFQTALQNAETMHQRFEVIWQVSRRICTQPQHFTMLEIIMASRSDAQLGALVRPFLVELERSVDVWWAENMTPLGIDPDEALHLRYVQVALIRGLALDHMGRGAIAEVDAKFDVVQKLFSRYFM